MHVREKQHLFVSYAREDLEYVRPVVEAVREELDLRQLPVDVWMDLKDLRPGEQWDLAIAEALRASIGFLFFVSPRSMQSDWVRRELEHAAERPGHLVIPVILHPTPDLPATLMERQWIELSKRTAKRDVRDAARQIAESTEQFLRTTPRPDRAISMSEAPRVAADLAERVRSTTPASEVSTSRDAVFVVHGHDADLLAVVETFLQTLGLKSIVLSREETYSKSLLEKFEQVARLADFAVVLLSADDLGASRMQYEAVGVGERALQFRARQNVILELGFFYGRLGWERVFIVEKQSDRVFPNFERPSDLGGAVFASVTDSAWPNRLRTRLMQAGLDVKVST